MSQKKIEIERTKAKDDNYSYCCLKIPNDYFERLNLFQMERFISDMIRSWILDQYNTKKVCREKKDMNVIITE